MLAICVVLIISAPGAISPASHPHASIVDGICTVQGQLGTERKFLIVPIDKYSVRHTEDVALRQCEYEGRKEQG